MTVAAQALAPGCRSNADTNKAKTETDLVITKALATEAHDDTTTAHSDHASITHHDRAPLFAADKSNDLGPVTPTPRARSTGLLGLLGPSQPPINDRSQKLTN